MTTHATENSFAAFEDASKLGADGLEFDVTITQDGQLVVYHGPKLYNNTVCKQEVRDICQMDWQEVQRCLLNNGEKI